MMELLPHDGWTDVARTGHLDQLERSLNDRITAESALLRAEMAELRADLQTEMAGLRADLQTEMAGLRADLRTELTSGIAAFRDELHRDQRTLQRQIILALVVALVSMVLTMSGLR
jgi:hypothetical protein